MNILVYNIRAVAGGEEAEVSVELSSGENAQTIKGMVSAAMLSELGFPSQLREPLPLERRVCETLFRFMKLHSAIKKGIVLLGYAQNSQKALKNKLMRKGYPADIAEEAAEQLSRMGFIREGDDAMLFAESLAKRRLYGKNRIRKELFSKGFSAEVIRETMEYLDVNFAEVCAKRMDSLGGLSVFETAETKRKAVAALLRYGFAYDDIREATAILQNEENE